MGEAPRCGADDLLLLTQGRLRRVTLAACPALCHAYMYLLGAIISTARGSPSSSQSGRRTGGGWAASLGPPADRDGAQLEVLRARRGLG
eukprot:8336787-Alexandrium_andersonii.AAC.1